MSKFVADTAVPLTPPTSLTRRTLLTGALASVAMNGMGWAQAQQAEESWILLGTQDGEGVYRARWDAAAGKIGVAELAIATPRPSYIALHPRLPVLYACNEHEGGAAGVSAFGIQRQGAVLTPLGHQQTHGDDPCYVSADRTGKMLFTANYGGGSLSVFPLNNVGMPGAMDEQFSCVRSGECGSLGPQGDRQDAPHLHSATVSPDNRSVLACDLADDAILIFSINLSFGAGAEAGEPLGKAVRVAARAGSGPRHVAFHPDGKLFYCIHELDCTVDAYTWNGVAADTRLIRESVVRLTGRSGDAAKPNTGAELALSRDGRFLYTSTRGNDQLSMLSIDRADHARLKTVQQLPTGGAKPRFIALDPTEKWVLSCHQDGSTVTVFARDARTGRLTPHGGQALPSPMCIVWV